MDSDFCHTFYLNCDKKEEEGGVVVDIGQPNLPQRDGAGVIETFLWPQVVWLPSLPLIVGLGVVEPSSWQKGMVWPLPIVDFGVAELPLVMLSKYITLSL